MLNQYLVLFLTLIFYQQRITCNVSLEGVGEGPSQNVDSRQDSLNQTVYIGNGWSPSRLASDVFHKSVEADTSHAHTEPFVNGKLIHNVQNPTPFIVNTPSPLVSQDFIHEQIAQTFTNLDAKYSSNTSSNPNKRIKLSAKIRKKSGAGSEAHPNLKAVSLKENIFKADIEEINRISDKHVPDLESASTNRNKNEQSELYQEPVQNLNFQSDSVVIKTAFDSIKNTTVLKAIYVPTYKNVTVFPGVTIQPNVEQSFKDEFNTFTNEIDAEDDGGIGSIVTRSIETFTKNHIVNVDLYKLYEALTGVSKPSGRSTARFAFTKNSFLTGFSLGFLAFALKKLLLPFFIGIQIVKSILIAMFLPSILGSVGKLVGKGVSNFAQTSGSSLGGGGGGGFHMGGGGGGDTIQDFEFKDTSNVNADTSGAESVGGQGVWSLPPSHLNTLGDGAQMGNYMMDGGLGQNKLNALHRYHSKYNAGENVKFGGNTGSFYYKDKPMQADFKVFQKIPMSSTLLANYDPFYSPLLSRIDSVFKQLNYKTESCRERLICAMYNNPAKYAPYSNLVSAQLSRELNELRKPTTDNPEILRFFRYMKAAKDGQDQADCGEVYQGCSTGSRGGTLETSPPMVTTFNDINRLVQARGFGLQEPSQSHPSLQNGAPSQSQRYSLIEPITKNLFPPQSEIAEVASHSPPEQAESSESPSLTESAQLETEPSTPNANEPAKSGISDEPFVKEETSLRESAVE